jgi:Ca-activated chloride channel family protein
MKFLRPILALALTLATAAPAQAGDVRLDARLSTPTMMAGTKQTAWLRVQLEGLADPAPKLARPAINLAIVVDQSGSMQGSKIEQAREAALIAVGRLSPDDFVAVVAYDTTVRVVVPATRASDRRLIEAGIRSIRANGDTALFAGVAKGAEEVRKFLDPRRVNRVLLLSDGLANVGPSSPAELGALGASLAREGIAVTTFGVGLGYNEDLMTELARRSDGNHAFIENAAELPRYFDLELGTATAVIGRDVDLRLRFPAGVRPLRTLGRTAEVFGAEVRASMSQIYAGQKQVLLVEVELPPGVARDEQVMASVKVGFSDLATSTTQVREAEARVRYTLDRAAVEAAEERAVSVNVVELLANEESERAVALRDQGRVQEARELLMRNSAYIDENDRRYNAPTLKKLKQKTDKSAKNVDAEGDAWSRERKDMRKQQYDFEQNSLY